LLPAHDRSGSEKRGAALRRPKTPKTNATETVFQHTKNRFRRLRSRTAVGMEERVAGGLFPGAASTVFFTPGGSQIQGKNRLDPVEIRALTHV
jgi:hypothetical protein